MKLLALDTSSLACSVALQIGTEISDRHELQAREHTRLVIPMVTSLLAEADIALGDLDAIVLGNGPGSFIGMRIAASVAQGLAFGASLKIVPVSSLAAVAAEVFATHDAAEVAVAQDAHMREIYLGVFARGAGGLPVALMDERLCGHTVIDELTENPDASRFAAGYGWQRYPDLLAVNRHRLTGVLDVLHPAARHLLPLGALNFSSGKAIEPDLVSPAYLRKKVAEVPASS